MNHNQHLKSIASLGGMARVKLYGNPGTLEGRKLGGLNSLKTHRKLNTGFKLAKHFRKPPKSETLAEFMGIIIGDGHLSKYQLSVTTNSETDIKHARYIKDIIRKLFFLDGRLRMRTDKKAVDVIASSVELAAWLNKIGMPYGNKLNNNLSLPVWIKGKKNWRKGFIRGLFDTDGCIYQDTHTIRGKRYKNLGWTITSYSAKLRNDILEILRFLGFTPTMRNSQKSVFMRKSQDIKRYFSQVKTKNSKHRIRYEKFKGRVPKRS